MDYLKSTFLRFPSEGLGAWFSGKEVGQHICICHRKLV